MQALLYTALGDPSPLADTDVLNNLNALGAAGWNLTGTPEIQTQSPVQKATWGLHRQDVPGQAAVLPQTRTGLTMQPMGHMPGFHIPGTLVPIGVVVEMQRQQAADEAAAANNAEIACRHRSACLLLFEPTADCDLETEFSRHGCRVHRGARDPIDHGSPGSGTTRSHRDTRCRLRVAA